MIYRWSHSSLKYAEYGGREKQDKASIRWYVPALGDPLPPLAQWRIPTLTQYIGNGDKKSMRIIADCVSSSSINLISQKAADALKDIWDKHATLYPVILDDRPDEYYYMVVVHTVIDCIDREKSIGKRHDDDTKMGQKGYFCTISDWVMREEEIGDNSVFVLPDDPVIIYTTETFKERVIAAGLTGFGFAQRTYDDETLFIS